MANAAIVNGHNAGQLYEANELSMRTAAIIETSVTSFAARSIRDSFPGSRSLSDSNAAVDYDKMSRFLENIVDAESIFVVFSVGGAARHHRG
jgi:hypothetical protein